MPRKRAKLKGICGRSRIANAQFLVSPVWCNFSEGVLGVGWGCSRCGVEVFQVWVGGAGLYVSLCSRLRS